MNRRAVSWGQAKTASYFSGGGSPAVTRTPDFQKDDQIMGLMMSHFPADYGRNVILRDPNLSFRDRVRLLGAIDQSAASTVPSENTVQMGKFLPAAVGAGLGLVGAALTAPIFGLTPFQKKMYGIGAGALGAVLNTYGRD
jgi:hypothetical protein